MSLVTLQVGQAGCQGGASLFQLLADEAAPRPREWSEAAERFFYMAEVGGQTRLTARAVLLDMEPKVVAAAQLAGRGAWHYSKVAALTRQSGSGNNWAQGALHHAPAVRQQVLGMLRRQAERCDRLSGFLVMQSMAGGTGSGLGSAMTAAVRDEYPTARILNHCIWPYDSGEVVVQPYNCMLTLSSLAEHSDGIILTENEALSAACQQLLGTPRPAFSDLNAVAARSLASLLLPCTRLQAPSVAAAAAAAGSTGRGGRGGRGGAGGRGRPAWDSGATEAATGRQGTAAAASAAAGGWDGTFSSGSRWEDEEPAGSNSGGSGGSAAGSTLDPLADIYSRLCSRPGYRLLTLRSCPQVPPTMLDFTPFSWPVVLKNVRQMQLAGKAVDTGLDWGSGSGGGSSTIGTSSATGSGSFNGGASRRGSLGASGSSSSRGGAQQCQGSSRSGPLHGIASSGHAGNRALASLLVLRGDQAKAADASRFADPSLWSTSQPHPSPLTVAASTSRLGKQQMLATLLSNDQSSVGPIGRMLGKACQLFDVRAYVHQYERHGLACSDVQETFERVEDTLERYRAL